MFPLSEAGTLVVMEVVTALPDLPESTPARASEEVPSISGEALVAELGGSSAETLTVLLADVEGSVRHWEKDRDAMVRAMAQLDNEVSEAASRHSGIRPVEQGEGDSFVVVFARAADAVECALGIQRALAQCVGPNGPLRVRMALHTGDVSLRPDGRYAGQAFNRCARVRGLAHGGQVLLSRATHDLVIDSGAEEASFKDLGEHRLRDLARPERVYQLCHAELPSEFPPLRSLAAYPNNLPQQLTSFIGRHGEMAQVREFLAEKRMITLTGAGGCGKTRLALHVAADALEEYPDGVWWVELAPLADGALVPGAVAAALSIREVAGEDLAETLARTLAGQQILVVLDNCEHLVEASSALVSTILRRCKGVSIIATSREPLGIDGETSVLVPSLAVPNVDGSEPAAVDSVRLFVDRARAVRPNLRIGADDARQIADICRRLDGIPLAIELAAARIRMLSPAQIAGGLTDRFHLLTGGARTALPRQRTLEASVDWSYRLLSEPERVLLGRLSVFAGGFDLDAAEDVCAGDGIERYAVLDLLSGLVDRSLVQIEEEAPDVRYRLLETIRVYARQRLTDADDAAAARNRHLDHYVALAEQAEVGLRGAAFATWSRQLEAELDNLRAAMDWALSSGHEEKHLRLTSGLLLFWAARGLYSEVRRSMEAALAAGATDQRIRAKALATAGLVWLMAGYYAAAARLAAESVELAREVGDAQTLQFGLTRRGWASFYLGDGGLEDLREAQRLAEQIDEPSVVIRALLYRGFVESVLEGFDEGRKLLDEAMRRAQSSGDLFFTAVGGYLAGGLEVYAGRFADAAALFERALEAGRTIGDRTFSTLALGFRGTLKVYQGDYEGARRSIDEALSASGEIGGGQGEQAVGLRGFWLWATGDPEAASETLVPSLQTWRTYGNQLWVCFSLWMLGASALARREFAEAGSYLQEAEAVARRAGYWPWLVLTLQEEARLARAGDDREQAEERAHEALRTAAEGGARPLVVDCLEVLAGVAADLESYAEAARLLGAAQRLRDEIGYVRFPVYRGGYEADVATVRAAMGDEEFEARWAEGAAMSMEEAVAYAARGRGERKRPSAGWESLTPTEWDVVRLVTQGLSNPEIAEKLFIARNTVKVHLSHVFSKLAVTSRAELAAEATRRGI